MKRFIAALCFAALAAGAQAAARTMQLDDIKNIVGVSDATISPDGGEVAFIVSRANYKTDKNDRTLMLFDVAAGTQRPLTFERAGLASPAWSPDGKRLAFLAQHGEGKNAQEQIYVMDMRGGDPIAITDAAQGIQQFAWRPDGSAIAYVTADEAPNKKQIERHLDAFVVGDQAYNDTSAPTPNHIWLVSFAQGQAQKPERLTEGTWSLPTAEPPSSPASPISWSPDGRFIAFTKMDNAYDADGDFAVVAILDTQTKQIRTLTSHGKLEGYGDFSPDGKKIAYWYPYNGDGAAENDVYVTDAAGGNGTDVTASADIDSNVQRAMWMPDSQSLLISGHKGTDAALWIKPLGGTARRIDLNGVQPVQGFWLDASIAKSGAIAFAGSTANHPTEIYYMSSASAAPKRLTSYNDATAALDLGAVHPIAWHSDGFDEDGVLTYPPGYDPAKKYPLVLVIHGGPNSASITSFSALNQVLAARGFLVFNPNYRGSDNLGEAYWHAIVPDAGTGPGRDVMAGIAAVEKAANVDTSRLAVSGWSYGGFMTSWMIGHYHVWKAAVSGAAVNNLVDEYALADNGVGWRYAFGGSPWQGKNMQNYLAESPITYAWNVTTPTLILSDTGDARVPITQSYEMYRALRDRGVPVRFFAYPVSGHFPGDPVRSMDVDRRWVEWLAQHLK